MTPTYLHGPAAGGPYRTPLAYVNVKAVFTNTVPVDAYRGAGRPEGTYQLERLVDKAAREMGIDPVEIRRKNFVKPEEFPYQTPLAVVYDSRQLPRDARQAPRDLGLRRLQGAAGGGGGRAAGCAASASPPGSSAAAWRRRS